MGLNKKNKLAQMVEKSDVLTQVGAEFMRQGQERYINGNIQKFVTRCFDALDSFIIFCREGAKKMKAERLLAESELRARKQLAHSPSSSSEDSASSEIEEDLKPEESEEEGASEYVKTTI